MTRSAAALAAVFVLSVSPPVGADSVVRGVVVKIEARELYVNLGKGQGVVAGSRLRLKRPIKLRHPVSGQWLNDWVPIGSARVHAVGDRISMAVADADLVAEVASGDRVEIYLEHDEVIAPADGSPAVILPRLDEATAKILEMWRRSSELSLDQRIAAWEGFLAARPSGPHAEMLGQDIAILREQRESLRLPDETALSPALGGVEHAAPSWADDGTEVALAFVVDEPARLASAWLHYRPRGDSTYQRLLLRREGDMYLRGSIPATAVRAPGVEYFVEVATTQGDIGTAVASPEQPVAVAVAGAPLSGRFGGERNRSEVSLRTSVSDFSTFDDRDGDRTDRFYMFEADVLYRIGGPLWGVRAGFGSVQGEGGFANRVYTASNPAPEVGFNYGYVEAEVRGSERIGVAVRLINGVGQRGYGVGAEGRLRLGSPDETNLSVGASAIAEIGFLSDLRLEVQTLVRVPFGLSVAITDQPSNGDLGVRLAIDLGWQVTDWLTPTLRASYQARTVDHAGLGTGLAAVFGW